MLSRLFNKDSRYKIHQMNVNEEDIMENFIYSLLNNIMSIIRIDRYSAITKFQEELNIITSKWYETYNNPDEKNDINVRAFKFLCDFELILTCLTVDIVNIKFSVSYRV